MQNKTSHLSITNDIRSINIKRIFYLTLISIPYNLIHIIIFYTNLSKDNPTEMKWRLGIIFCHASLAVLMSIFGVCAYIISKKALVATPMHLMIYAALITVFVFGVLITAIDQLVTASITPFLVACTIVSVVFLIRPLNAFLFYLFSYAGFFFALSTYQKNPSILLSNRVNGMTTVGIGLFVSIMMWKMTTSNLIQKQLIAEQQEELMKKNGELERLAFFDQLTGVYNRRKFEELLKNEISRISRYHQPASIVLIDIDNFKRINDHYGHPVGDRVLQEFAGLLKNNIRDTDSISRWGGEEFLILLPNTALEEAKKTAEKLRQIVENYEQLNQDSEIHLTASFGVASLPADRQNALEIAYKNADDAMYLAKENGRNRVEAK